MNSNTDTCPNCGETVRVKGDAFCVYCHASLDGDDFLPEFRPPDQQCIPDSCPTCSTPFEKQNIQIQNVSWFYMILPLVINVIGGLIIVFVFMAIFSWFGNNLADRIGGLMGGLSGLFLAGAYYLKYMRLKWQQTTTLNCPKCRWQATLRTTPENSG